MDRTMGIYGLLNNRWSLILAMVTGAVHDAVAACWDAKYAYRAMRRAHRRHEQNRVLGAAAIPFKFMNPLRPGRDLASQDRLTRTTDEPRRTGAGHEHRWYATETRFGYQVGLELTANSERGI